MSKILDWIKKHVWQTVLIGFGLFFLPLILVHIAYRIQAISPWFASTWEAGELITYIAGFEAFAGTVLLGSIAIHQNDKANEINSRLISIEEKNSQILRFPVIEIVKHDLKQMSTWQIFDCQMLIMCNEEMAEIYNQLRFASEQANYFLTFSITNKSTSNVIIKVRELNLSTIWKDSPLIAYHNIPSDFHPALLDLAPNSCEQIGLIINQPAIEWEELYNGRMVLSVLNDASEEYQYCINFFVGITGKPDASDIIITGIIRSPSN